MTSSFPHDDHAAAEPRTDIRGRREFLRIAGAGAVTAKMLTTGTAAIAAEARPRPSRSDGANNFYKSDHMTVRRVTFNRQLTERDAA